MFFIRGCAYLYTAMTLVCRSPPCGRYLGYYRPQGRAPTDNSGIRNVYFPIVKGLAGNANIFFYGVCFIKVHDSQGLAMASHVYLDFAIPWSVGAHPCGRYRG